MSRENLPELWRVVEDNPLILRHQMQPKAWTEPEFIRFYQAYINGDQRMSFVMRLKETGQVVGTSSYLDIRPADRGLEIGATWIAVPWQGTVVNPSVKLLMFQWAFENWNAIRVQLKTDARNLQSQRAMEKLGLVREGVLRHHIIMPDGYLRDSVMYSATHLEWPALKERLLERLSKFPSPA